MNAFFGHLRNVVLHRHYVRKYCFKLGLYWRGIKHDLSKYSPTEFLFNIKYYGDGKRSPIDNAKDVLGYSPAWLHHRGRNDHHHVYWVDNLDDGGTCIKMSPEATCEMICDFIAASIVYNRSKKFDILNELTWWRNRISNPLAMHLSTIIAVNQIFSRIAICVIDDYDISKDFLGVPKSLVLSTFNSISIFHDSHIDACSKAQETRTEYINRYILPDLDNLIILLKEKKEKTSNDDK